MLAFLPGATDATESELASVPSLSTGLMSATQGNYIAAQLLLDITQGARVSYSAYSPPLPPALSLRGVQIAPWAAELRRAAAAPQLLAPGLLASAIPGGGAYAGVTGQSAQDALAGADRGGRLAAVSLGAAATLPARVAALRERHRLVLADLPAGREGYAQLRLLSATRPPGELLLVVQRPPDAPGHELLWAAVGGLGGGRTLSSATTEQRGLIAAIDLAPSILRHLDLPVPAAVRGQPLRTDGAFDGARLRALKSRLAVIYPRRLPALAALLAVWAALALLGNRAWALRVGALALLWTPVAELLPGALEPSRAVEYALLAATCFLLGFLTDRLLPWPRAPLAPALAAVVVLSADALAGTQLLMRSLLGPNPIYGARFYGIGNELKSALAVLVFSAVAAALYPLGARAPAGGEARRDSSSRGPQRDSSDGNARHSPSESPQRDSPSGDPRRDGAGGRRAATTMALGGLALAVVEGSARVGAGVGAVILVSAGTAVATVLLLPGRLTRRRALIVLLAPAAGLLALAALDLATAHGTGHFTGSILHARSAGDLRDVLVRRYSAAYDELKHGAMPLATAFALGAGVLAVRHRDRVLAPVAGDRGWSAALAGGLTAGVVGALTEDSGPVLLVVAVFALACVLAYLWGRPAPGAAPTPRSAGRSRAARSRARTPPEALSR
ncbi:MAG TPA: hypothetical protein VID29_05680 [Solirubrobacteraceae bacterium]